MSHHSTTLPLRRIDQRSQPDVRGVDLLQALNYVAADDASVEFCYDRYTSARLPYQSGDRPIIEAIAKRVTKNATTEIDAATTLMSWVAEHVVWAGHHRKRTGRRLASDRGISEEALIASGIGWCNEQARVLCCLTQAVGLPSRIVFASDPLVQYGHCTTEVLVTGRWLMLDQSLGFAFVHKREPVRAVDVWGDRTMRAVFSPVYRLLCDNLIAYLGREAIAEDFAMAAAADPLEGFAIIGFHNHFLI